MKPHRKFLGLLASAFLMISCAVGPYVVQKAGTPTQVLPTQVSPTATPPVFSTATPIPTATPFPTKTVTPTPEATSTSTPLPTSESIPGFARFSGKNMEMWLPDTFVGGNLETDLDTIVATIRKMGSQYASMADMIEKNRDMFSLWALDQKLGTTGFMTNASVASQVVLSAVTLKMYTEANLQSLPESFKVTGTEYLDIGPYKASRTLVTATLQNVKVKEVFYILQDGATMWLVTFATGDGEFSERYPTFEKSIATFRSLK